MTKTFTMTVTFDESTQTMSTETANNGFSPLEILGVLGIKKQDFLHQLYNPNDFVRKIQGENGEAETVVYKGAE